MVPTRQGLASQQSLRERRRVHDAGAFVFQIRNQTEQRSVVERVVAVGKHAIEFCPVEEVFENLQRKNGYANKTNRALLLQFAKRGVRFLQDLVEVPRIAI